MWSLTDDTNLGTNQSIINYHNQVHSELDHIYYNKGRDITYEFLQCYSIALVLLLQVTISTKGIKQDNDRLHKRKDAQ